MTQLNDLDILRSRDDVWIAEKTGDGARIILAGEPPQYLRVSPSTVGALTHLASQRLGSTVGRATTLFPTIDVQGLVDLNLVDLVPVAGRTPSPRLVAEMWRRNVTARLSIRRHGWSALARWMSVTDADSPVARPLLFDEIEAAARISFAFPATSRQCTIVALTVLQTLRARGIQARIAVIAESQQSSMHSYVTAGWHIIDPSDTIQESAPLVRLGPRQRESG